MAFHKHPEKLDGIIYPSRLNGHTNVAVFDRAIVKLQAVRKMKLIAAPGLATVLNDLRVSIVEPDPWSLERGRAATILQILAVICIAVSSRTLQARNS